MGIVAERLNLRLFIDGIEVPVLGAKCTFAEGTLSTAAIQVVATDEIYDIEPRAFVTLFVYDNFDFIDSPEGETNAVRIGPQDLRRWKLLFSGEFVSISMSKTASSRSATLQCADHTNYWDFIRQQYINFSNAGVELFEAAFLGIKNDRLKFFDVVTQGANSKLFIWLTQSKNADGDASLYLGMQRVMREMFFSVNDFYAQQFNRLRIGDSIVGLAEDKTAAKLFKLQFFEKFIKNKTGGAGGMVTARQLIDGLLGPVMHTYVTVPCPKFDRRGVSLGFKPKKTDEIAKGIIPRDASWPGASLNQTVVKPDTWFLAPPICNVVFPHMYRSLTYGRNYLAEPTRMFLRTSLMFTGKDKWLTERFYAPDFKSFNDQLFKQGGYLERMAGTNLPHERFVGLNPAMVWENDLPAYVAKGPRREYLSQLTHYLFWKYKFGTRSVQVSGPLNLNLIPGYPGLVMDRVQSDTGVTRHFQGNIASVVHSVDQMGGWTHFTLAGARVHDEQVDFDDGGRSLEEVVARGTDGFLDDRYDLERIGPEVYQQLFGCDSAVDILTESERRVTETTPVTTTVPRTLNQAELNTIAALEAQRDARIAAVEQQQTDDFFNFQAGSQLNPILDTAEIFAEHQRLIDAILAGATEEVTRPVSTTTTLDLMPLAVEKLATLYRSVVKEGGNVDLFAKTLTNRPKANFPEMMGTDLANVPPNRNQVGDGASNASLQHIFESDLDIAQYDGFFAAAVNPEAETTKDATYSAQVGTTTPQKVGVEEVLTERKFNGATGEFEDVPLTGADAPGVSLTETKVIYESKPIYETATYPLKADLIARREKVLAYVKSLLFRGLRG